MSTTDIRTLAKSITKAKLFTPYPYNSELGIPLWGHLADTVLYARDMVSVVPTMPASCFWVSLRFSRRSRSHMPNCVEACLTGSLARAFSG